MINPNSVSSYRKLDNELSQSERIFQIIKKFGSVNSRWISQYSGIERSAVVARINKLMKENRIEVAHSGKCLTTGKTVDFYSEFKPKPVAKPGEQTMLW